LKKYLQVWKIFHTFAEEIKEWFQQANFHQTFTLNTKKRHSVFGSTPELESWGRL